MDALAVRHSPQAAAKAAVATAAAAIDTLARVDATRARQTMIVIVPRIARTVRG